MHIFLLILAIHGLLFGFGFLIAGWCALLGAEPEEEAEFKKEADRARQQGWLEAWRWYQRFRRNFSSPQRIAANWAARPEVRKYIYAGAAFMAFAAVLGIPLGAYK